MSAPTSEREDAREALALDATGPAAYCAPCGRALTEEEVMCVDCASDDAPAQPGEGEPVETRCSCGAYVVMCKGEYHDCAVERGLGLHKRQVEALESIARALLERRGGKGLFGKGGRG